MYEKPSHDTGRIAPDHHAPSPSTGWRETAALLDAPNAHAVEPVEQDTDDDQDRDPLATTDPPSPEVIA